MRKILKPKDFPALLKQIPDQPERLYMEGELPPEDAIYLAVVGARRFTTYGKEACERIISGLNNKKSAVRHHQRFGHRHRRHRPQSGVKKRTENYRHPRLRLG